MTQPEFRPSCRQIFCKATSDSADNFRPRSRLSRSSRPRNTGNLTRHEFFVKKFERTLL